MNDLPGMEAAKAAGYTLLNSAGDKSSAVYTKDGIFLTVNANRTAEVWASYKTVTIRSGLLSFPHPRLSLFEKQVQACIPLT